MRDVDQVRARVQAAVDAAGPAGMVPGEFERELTGQLDALAREFMGQFPELPQMSLDEWLAQHHDALAEMDRRAGYVLLAAYDEDHEVEDAPSP